MLRRYTSLVKPNLPTFTPSSIQKAHNSYKQWPRPKIRKIGRPPSEWKGQGGRRSRIAYDKRYALSGKDINDTTEGLTRGGNSYMNQLIGYERTKSNPAVLKYYDYTRDREVIEIVPEMIPEFIVPDLADFKLKPYVSYRVTAKETDFPKHTAAQLFKETYQQELIKNLSEKDKGTLK